MKDTSDEINRKFRDMLLARSGEERLKMGCSMHAAAQALAKASLAHRHPGASPSELKRLLFLHFYGSDFEPSARKRIASALARRSRSIKALERMKPTARKRLVRTKLASVKSSGAGAVRESGEKYGRKVIHKPKPSRP